MKIELDDKKKKMIAGGALALLLLILIVPSFFKSDAKAEEKQAPTPAVQQQAEQPKPQPPKAEPIKIEEVKPDPVAPKVNGSQAVGSVINLNNVQQPTNTISDLNVDNLIAQAGVDAVSPVVANTPSAITSDNVVKTIVVDQNGKVIEENAKNVEKTLSDPNAKVVAAINVGQNGQAVPAVAAAVPAVSAVPVMQAVAVKPASEIEVIGAKKKVVGNDVYVTASGSYNGISSIQPIQIRDGDRTIYVDFKPEIVVSGNCCNGSCGKGAVASSSKSVNLSENKSTVISKTTKKKVKIGNKSTKKSKRGASGVLVPKNKKVDQDESNIKIGEEDEYNRISCVGGCKSKLEDKRVLENREPVVQANGRRKCNKAGGCSGLRQDVYVINNIVNVDEDEIITDKMLDRMENVDKPIVKNVNRAYVEDGRKVGYVGRLYADEHQNDVIRDDYNKFGEIAFVDGEYD